VISVLVVDRPRILRRALRTYLALALDLRLVGEASSKGEALLLVEQHKPDVVVLDAEMRDLDALAAARALRAVNPGTAIVVSALDPDALAHDDSTRVIGKHEGVDALLAAIQAAAGSP
jgi:DNA-binding NarL/FixJ family response regulator